MIKFISIFSVFLAISASAQMPVDVKVDNDLGQIILGEEREFSVELKNNTQNAIVVEFKNHCSCVAITTPILHIEAGKSQDLKGVLFSASARGPNMKQEITVIVGSQRKNINLTGTIKRAYLAPSVYVLDDKIDIKKKFEIKVVEGFPEIASISVSSEKVASEFDSANSV